MKVGNFTIHMQGNFQITAKNTFESKLKEYKIMKGCLYSRFKGKKSNWTKLKVPVVRNSFKRKWINHNVREPFPSTCGLYRNLNTFYLKLRQLIKNDDESYKITMKLWSLWKKIVQKSGSTAQALVQLVTRKVEELKLVRETTRADFEELYNFITKGKLSRYPSLVEKVLSWLDILKLSLVFSVSKTLSNIKDKLYRRTGDEIGSEHIVNELYDLYIAIKEIRLSTARKFIEWVNCSLNDPVNFEGLHDFIARGRLANHDLEKEDALRWLNNLDQFVNPDQYDDIEYDVEYDDVELPDSKEQD
jgi:hypothetical protein